ncbi:response regulator [uncultured Maribacter sp.]|uniref:response regulator n=1 Tax=uncultured Maribacter sp. TaxID=431308 RepID=UPI0030DA8A3B|tara:strand:- start:3575 stop:3961 length:387 start_codon:yes stop_codon:yes gene_type:complete
MKKIKILIVEDDKFSQFILQVLSKPFAKEIVVVENGLEAVDYCKENLDIDLILMDIRMPIMDGYEATKNIRQFNNDVVIVAQTAYCLLEDKEKALSEGFNYHLPKPVEKELLQNIIEKEFKDLELCSS